MHREMCQNCTSSNVIAVLQYSDEEGKIITMWECCDCGHEFITMW
jgi:hypothetical protein